MCMSHMVWVNSFYSTLQTMLVSNSRPLFSANVPKCLRFAQSCICDGRYSAVSTKAGHSLGRWQLLTIACIMCSKRHAAFRAKLLSGRQTREKASVVDVICPVKRSS